MIATPTIITPTIYPPLTLTVAERQTLDTFTQELRAKFQVLAGRFEFINGEDIADAERRAFTACLAIHHQTNG